MHGFVGVRVMLASLAFALFLQTALSETSLFGDKKERPLPPVLIITKASFKHLVGGNKAVLVEYYSPNCPVCRQFEPRIPELNKQLGVTQKVLFGKADVLADDQGLLEYGLSKLSSTTHWPVFKLYKPLIGDKKKQGIEYSGPVDVDSLVKFVFETLGLES
mmetsp:Transcript_45754/g.74646  ORF Transcript_45754/g.74646 Transcript_45754/m.74646 type:complete len:161 (-) Transcript_45754:372-854(-)